jgi:hypothetical protein
MWEIVPVPGFTVGCQWPLEIRLQVESTRLFLPRCKGRLEMNPDIRSQSNVTWDREVAIEFRADLLLNLLVNTSLL